MMGKGPLNAKGVTPERKVDNIGGGNITPTISKNYYRKVEDMSGTNENKQATVSFAGCDGLQKPPTRPPFPR